MAAARHRGPAARAPPGRGLTDMAQNTTDVAEEDRRGGPGVIRVSTEMFPPRDRFSAFREEFARRHLAMDVIDHSGGCPHVEVAVMPLGPVAAISLAAGPSEFVRDRHHLKDGRDVFVLELIGSGPIHYVHAGREQTREAGSAAFFDQGRQWRAVGPRGGAVMSVTVGAAALRALVRDPEDLAGRPVPPGGMIRLLNGYLRALAAAGFPPPDLAPRVGAHLLDLVAAVLGPCRDASEAVAAGGVRTARLEAVLAAIAAGFSDPGFNVDALARSTGLSRRYVQSLLEETGRPFTEHVLDHRLARALALLTDPRCRHLSIIAIAGDCGFGDVSHFNRVFRRRHGNTPSGVRAGATRDVLRR